MADSICWHCKNACVRCVKPVDGWEAEYRPIFGATKESPRVPSWLVYSCPNYLPDERASEYGEPKVVKQNKKPYEPTTVKCLENIYTKEVHHFRWWKDAADFVGVSPKHLARRIRQGFGVIDRFRVWEEPVNG